MTSLKKEEPSKMLAVNIALIEMLNILLLFLHFGEGAASNQLKLIQDMLESYEKKAKPTWDNTKPINITFSMDLYQILELNEPQQYVRLNAWIIERWNDEFLYWNPLEYGNITELRLPYDCIWLPDTTLYNSLVMKDEDSRRLLNAKLTTNSTRKAALVELLYPTIYKFSCLLNLRFFPYDIQECTMTFSSWTYDQKGIDYLPYSKTIGTSNYLENEGWFLLKTMMRRHEVKYSCCPNNYTLLKLTFFLQRKPLFYLINLIIPTSIITLIAIVGFFTTSSASGMREEKVSLGITTLLSMSILMLMVSDEMPTTSTFIPLINWFILSMIFLISLGTLASSFVIAVQKRGRLGERLTSRSVRIATFFSRISLTDTPNHFKKGTLEYMEAPPPLNTYKNSLKISNKMGTRRMNGTRNFGKPTSEPKRTRSAFNYIGRRRNGQSIGYRQTPGQELERPFPSDKSTEPLADSIVEETVLEDPAGSATTPTSFRNHIVEAHPLKANSIKVRHLSLGDDVVSQEGRVSPATARYFLQQRQFSSSARLGKGDMEKQIKLLNENIRLSRQLAQKEYEWLATILERSFFVIFVCSFFLLTGGINLVGYIHWSSPEVNFEDYSDI